MGTTYGRECPEVWKGRVRASEFAAVFMVRDRAVCPAQFDDTVPAALARIGEPAALAHFDVGTDDPVADFELAAWLSAVADPLVRPGGIVVSDRAMPNPRWASLPPPPRGADDIHVLYRVLARGSPSDRGP